MIKPINIIEPLREDLSKLIPNSYFTTTSFKRWVVASGFQDLWGNCLEYAKRQQSVYILDDMANMIAYDALTLLLNHFFQDNVKNFSRFIIQLIINYSHTEGKSLDTSSIREDMIIAGISEEGISAMIR